MSDIEEENTSLPDKGGQLFRDAINQSGAPNTLKSKFFGFVAKIVTGGIMHPQYQHIRENLDTVEGRSIVNREMAKAVALQAIEDPEQMERAKARFLGDMNRKQNNIENVLLLTHEIIEKDPTAGAQDLNEETEIDDDWMATFVREAENASSEELRERLARLLSGEIRKPKFVSRSTIRIMAELEQQDLTDFSDLLKFAHAHGIVNQQKDDPKFLQKILNADRAGLVISNERIGHSWTLKSDGLAALLGHSYSLIIEGTEGQRVGFSQYPLSRSGAEIAFLLDNEHEKNGLVMAAKLIDKAGLSKVAVGKHKYTSPSNIVIPQPIFVWTNS